IMHQADIYQYKSYLFTIAYHMLGDIDAAEDLVQDTFESWLQKDQEEVKQVKAYLSRILINKAIDKLEQLKKQREAYTGLWLPQPLLLEQDQPEEYSLEYAVLFLLEKLNPYERAVFVLKEVFSLPHSQIASTLGITADNCRQLFHRAKDKLRAPTKQPKAQMEKQQELLDAFLQAVYEKNYSRLEEIFLQDIVMYQDGGGKMSAALKPIAGGKKIIKFLEAVLELEPEAVFDVKPVWVNGTKGYIIYRNALPDTIFTIEATEDKINKLFFIRNPDKILLS
ncbi:MAG: sigma-70 family RNA polymerase sigma factor, partial [Bacteroidota bacterium]|nr:sigma-70 family RNA polymerase sigma factor [Bacteroidota bacterium]